MVQKKWMFTIVGILIVLAVIQGIYLNFSVVKAPPGEIEFATASTSADVTNSVPVASSASLDGGSSITLFANSDKIISASVTITDNNGCGDISSVNATLFDTNTTSDAANNNRTHYENSACVSNGGCTLGGTDLTDTYNCSFTLAHYANPTDAGSNHSVNTWTVNITPFDNATGTVDTDSQEINTLTAFTASSTLAFGTLALGADTGTTNTNGSITNTGNEQLDVQLDAFGVSDGDNFAMGCTTGSINVSFMEYRNTAFAYNESSNELQFGVNMTDTAVELELNVTQGTEEDTTPQKNISFGLALPGTGVGGDCTGTVTFTAVSDPNAD